MTKKILVAIFLAAFGIAMANISLAADDQIFCPALYQPVCGEVQVQCIRAPCYPAQQTFGNRCEADRAHATNIQPGTCDSQPQNLVNTSRKLTNFDDTVVQGVSTLSFSGSTFGARVCNIKSGSYSVSGNILSVSNVISTLMACQDPLASYEGAFDLSGARYNILGRHLIINTVMGHRFDRQSSAPIAVPLANTSWKLAAFNGQTYTLSTPITLSFASSTLTASICSTRTATYTTNGNMLSATWTTPLTVMCTMQLNPYQQAFDLSDATYTFSGNMLLITTSEGDTYLWTPRVVSPQPIFFKDRIYGFVIRQLNQIMKARGYDTIEEKQTFVQSILDKLNQPNGIFYTRHMTIIRTFIRNALQYYLDNITRY